jgi:hypothetical protein
VHHSHRRIQQVLRVSSQVTGTVLYPSLVSRSVKVWIFWLRTGTIRARRASQARENLQRCRSLKRKDSVIGPKAIEMFALHSKLAVRMTREREMWTKISNAVSRISRTRPYAARAHLHIPSTFKLRSHRALLRFRMAYACHNIVNQPESSSDAVDCHWPHHLYLYTP